MKVPDAKNASEGTLSVEQVPQLFPEAAQHPRLGLVDGVHSHAQLGADLGGGASIDRAVPERLPGPLLEVGADQLQAAKQQAVLCGRVGGVVRSLLGDLEQPLLRVAAAD